MYLNKHSGVLDFEWDSAPVNLFEQLMELGFDVNAAANTPDQLLRTPSTAAYVIPVQNGNELYTAVEDMDAVADFVTRGGLVVVLDAGVESGPSQLVAQALRYQGDWLMCKRIGTNDKSLLGSESARTDLANQFLPGPWPQSLEDVKTTTVSTWCRHQDASAVSWPLYVALGDDMKTVAQAFGKVGTPGAVVHLGYSWKEGSQKQWGALLAKLINDFANGAYHPPADAEAATRAFPIHGQQPQVVPGAHSAAVHSVHAAAHSTFETILDAASELAAKATNLARRSLASPSPAPVTSPTNTPLPSPSPSTNASGLYLDVVNMLPFGCKGYDRPISWRTDKDFKAQRRAAPRSSPIDLIRKKKFSCPDGACAPCPRAWTPKTGETEIDLFFREPLLVTSITIKEVFNPAITEVFLLPWPATTIPDSSLSAPQPVVALGRPLWSGNDTTPCPGVLKINVGPARSGINTDIPPGSWLDLPLRLQRKAAGGIRIKVKALTAVYISTVKIDGRVLYPIQAMMPWYKKYIA